MLGGHESWVLSRSSTECHQWAHMSSFLGAPQTIPMILLRWTWTVHGATGQAAHIQPSDLGFLLVSSHMHCVNEVRPVYSLDYWPLSALAHISPFHTKVLSAFELLILRDAHHFMLAWKMECKVPGDWFVLSCPSDSSPWQYSIEHYDVIENSWTTKLLWARHPTQRLRYIKKMFGTSK